MIVHIGEKKYKSDLTSTLYQSYKCIFPNQYSICLIFYLYVMSKAICNKSLYERQVNYFVSYYCGKKIKQF